MSDRPATELVLLWTPFDSSGFMAFTLDDIDRLRAELESWNDPWSVGESMGRIDVVVRPEGWTASLPEHEGW